MPAQAARKKTGQHGGQNKKSLEHHKQAGTYRASRHKPKTDLTVDLFPKPKHLPEQRGRVHPRLILNKSDELAVANGCWFDMSFARHARAFMFRYLRLWEGEWRGRRFKLLPWQWENVVRPLFGWFRWDEERGQPVRRFNWSYIEVPKKNGKSPLAAAIGCYLLCGDGEGGAGVFSAATKKEQAAIVHRNAVNMIKASPELEPRTKINKTNYQIAHLGTDGIYRALASEEGGVEGLNGSGFIGDEMHVWKGRAFFDALKYMGVGRRNFIGFMITTAGEDMSGICREQHEYGEAVNAGLVKDDTFLSYIRAAEPKDDPGDPAVWAKANPSMGPQGQASPLIFSKEMEQTYQRASQSPAALNAFKRYRLNCWGLVEEPWLPLDDWAICESDYTEESLHGSIAHGGLDMSRTRDLTAFVLAVPKISDRAIRDAERDARRRAASLGVGDSVDDGEAGWNTEQVQSICLIPRMWIPEVRAKHIKKMVDYFAWNKYIEILDGKTIDKRIVFERIKELCEQFDIGEIRFDRRFVHDDVDTLCDEIGAEAVDFPQTSQWYSRELPEFERRVVDHSILHPGNEVLSWQAGHAKVKRLPAGGMILCKPEGGDYRTIDGLVASVMACSAVFGGAETGSVYDERGPIVL